MISNQHDLLLAAVRRNERTGGLEALPPTMQYVKDLTPFVEERNRLQAEMKRTKAEITELDLERRAAPNRRAAAVRSGTGDVRSDAEIDKARTTAEDRLDAIRRAFDQIDTERAKLLARNRATYLAEAEKHTRPLREKARDAVEAMESAWRAVVTLESACRAIANGGDGTSIPTLPTLDVGPTPRVDLIVVAMLAALADPVVKPTRAAGTSSDQARYQELLEGKRSIGTGWGRLEEAATGQRSIEARESR